MQLRLKDGSADVTLPVPAPGGSEPSFFLVGLPKAGSTLLNRVMRPVSNAAGFQYFSLYNELVKVGVEPDSVSFAASGNPFLPEGYCYGGFRGLGGDLTLPEAARGRTILLVRDPRDMLTSLYFSVAYSHRPPPTGSETAVASSFRDRRSAAQSSSIDEYVLAQANSIAGAFALVHKKTLGLEPKVFRYEDIVFDKARWLEDMLAYLQLSIPKGLVARVIAKNDVVPDKEDVNAHIRRVTPGDFREKLKPDTIERLDALLKPVLERYGYA